MESVEWANYCSQITLPFIDHTKTHPSTSCCTSSLPWEIIPNKYVRPLITLSMFLPLCLLVSLWAFQWIKLMLYTKNQTSSSALIHRWIPLNMTWVNLNVTVPLWSSWSLACVCTPRICWVWKMKEWRSRRSRCSAFITPWQCPIWCQRGAAAAAATDDDSLPTEEQTFTREADGGGMGEDEKL